MTMYNLPDGTKFIKTIINQGQGLYAPNEGINEEENSCSSLI